MCLYQVYMYVCVAQRVQMYINCMLYIIYTYIGGILFLCGLGIGLFQSPNSACNMLSVSPKQRKLSYMRVFCAYLTYIISCVYTMFICLYMYSILRSILYI